MSVKLPRWRWYEWIFGVLMTLFWVGVVRDLYLIVGKWFG